MVIKLSSMGDVFHTLPAITDVSNHFQDININWIVEENFAEIPLWHRAVNSIFKIALRRWKKNIFVKQTRLEYKEFFKQIKNIDYEIVVDAQGLIKSALVGKQLKRTLCGFDIKSAREPLASIFYNHRYNVPTNIHAINRLRILFSKIFKYNIDLNRDPDFGLKESLFVRDGEINSLGRYIVILPFTSWDTKKWPYKYWQWILKRIAEYNFNVFIPWGNHKDYNEIKNITSNFNNVIIPNREIGLTEVARILKYAKATLAVDTGLAHISAAFRTPTVVIYRVTNPKLIGVVGKSVEHITSPLYKEHIKKFKSDREKELSLKNISPEIVWSKLSSYLF